MKEPFGIATRPVAASAVSSGVPEPREVATTNAPADAAPVEVTSTAPGIATQLTAGYAVESPANEATLSSTDALTAAAVSTREITPVAPRFATQPAVSTELMPNTPTDATPVEVAPTAPSSTTQLTAAHAMASPGVEATLGNGTDALATTSVSTREITPVATSFAMQPAVQAVLTSNAPALLNIVGAAIGLEVAPVCVEPALIAVAHGSRDPRSAATMAAVVAQLAAGRPGVDVRLAFLDLNAPSVEQVVDAVAAQGHTHVVVVPLLLGNAFHARVDLPGLLAAARARHPKLQLTQADVLGPDARLIGALRDRVAEAAASGASANRLGIAVAGVGSSSPTANARTAEVARRLAELTGHLIEICFATTEPSLPQAISRLRSRGADEVLVAPWFLAPGLLTDRLVSAAPDVVHADVIGPHAALTDIVWNRYDAALANTLTLSA